MKPDILAVGVLPAFLSERLQQTFSYHHLPSAPATPDLLALAPKVRALVGTGESIVPRTLLDQFPKIEIVSVFGVGYDGVDVAAVREKGIPLTNTPGVLTDDVADLGMGMVLAVARKMVVADRFVRSGGWAKGPFPPLATKVSGSRLGIIGLGRIGKALARRAEAFGMSIAYTDLAPVAGTPYAYYPTATALAGAVDFLVVAAYGGPTTRGLVNADVLNALGPKGVLINIARGSVVNEAALVEALTSGALGGAGLDVFADEPNVPPALLTMNNVVLTPHMASGTIQTRQAMADIVYGNLVAHFAGTPLLTPVPG